MGAFAFLSLAILTIAGIMSPGILLVAHSASRLEERHSKARAFGRVRVPSSLKLVPKETLAAAFRAQRKLNSTLGGGSGLGRRLDGARSYLLPVVRPQPSSQISLSFSVVKFWCVAKWEKACYAGRNRAPPEFFFGKLQVAESRFTVPALSRNLTVFCLGNGRRSCSSPNGALVSRLLPDGLAERKCESRGIDNRLWGLFGWAALVVGAIHRCFGHAARARKQGWAMEFHSVGRSCRVWSLGLGMG